MKIYYYKQQQNTFELFGKKGTPLKLRYIVIGVIVFLLAILGYWKLKHHSSQKLLVTPLPMTPPTPAPIIESTPTQTSALDEETQATSMKIQTNIEQNSAKTEEVPTLKIETKQSLNDNKNQQIVTVKQRDTLGKICSRLGVERKEALEIIKCSEEAKALKKLQPGQKISFTINNHQIQELNYKPDELSTLIITRNGEKHFKSQLNVATLEPRQSFARFIIDGSVYSSAQNAGLNQKRTTQLASIFKSSVDFNKGNHSGDIVCVLFQDYYLNNKKVKDGEIVAAEFKTATNTYQAVRFTDPKGNSGYYSPDGTSLQKRFLPAPLKFTRISSLFNPKRWHPVLHKFRHHQGVDYAAPYGTPVKSVATGTIAHLGRKGGYGNTIVIKHESSYSTLYGHLSKYASNLKVGSHVTQGQLIGYVGSSGLATGPHLHFEFKINGVHRNPLTVAMPNTKSITHAYRSKFHNEVKKLLARIDAHKNSNSG